MALQPSQAAEIASYGSAGELLTELSNRMKADRALESGRENGLVQTLGYSPTKHSISDIDEYQPGVDKPQDLNIAETYASRRPMANKGRGRTGPRNLSVLADFDPRYDGTTGLSPLHGLARMSVAMSALAAEKIGSGLQAVVVAEGRKPVEHKARPVDSVWTLRQYDKHVNDVRSSGVVAGVGSVALANGLRLLIEEGPRAREDAAIVVSDFVMGAERDEHGAIVQFNWEKPLRELNAKLGDRLFVVRLTTPAQRQLPAASRYSRGEGGFEMDPAERLNEGARYAELAVEKSRRIAAALRRIRHIELDATSTRPSLELIDFIFGEPKQL